MDPSARQTPEKVSNREKRRSGGIFTRWYDKRNGNKSALFEPRIASAPEGRRIKFRLDCSRLELYRIGITKWQEHSTIRLEWECGTSKGR